MTLATREHAARARRLTMGLVEKTETLVRKFRNYSNPELGIGTTDVLEPLGARGKCDPVLEAQTAQRCENFLRAQMRVVDETSRASLPTWVKNGLALITVGATEDLTDKVVSVQTLPNRSGRIHFMDIVTERAKGNIPDRARLFDALAGWRGQANLSSEQVEKEPAGVAGGTDYAPVLGYGPVIPRTLVLTDGAQIVRDDGNGNLTGDVGAPGGGITNTIDYLTGQVSLRFAAGTGGAVKADYTYNIEAALVLPEYGVQLRSEEVQARPRAIGASWSPQALMDFQADYGIDAEPTILEYGAKIINLEKFKHVINFLRANATGGALVFDNVAPVAISYRDHLKTFGIYLGRLQNLVWETTQMVRPNVAVIHPSTLFAVAYQDGYEGTGKFANDGISGPREVGRLTQHDLTVIVDPTMPRDEGILTHRGAEFVSTAAVLGSYVDLYRAPVHSRGFRKDYALLTEYALKMINSDQVATFKLINL